MQIMLKKALRINENYDFAHIELGRLLNIMGDHEKAIIAIKKAITINPNNAVAYGSLGQILIYADQPDKAIVQLEKAFRLDPFPQWEGYFHMGFAYQNMKKFHSEVLPILSDS